jgi:hypothetical protein
MLTGLPPQVGVALLTPDLFVTGAWPALAARFDELGLHVAAFAVVNATDATMASLYEGNAFKAGRARIASTLGRKLPLLDMNVAVALAGSAQVDVPALLDAAKGPSAHGTRKPGDLREAGRIAHRCMSLFHTPDAELAGRDARILFGAAADRLDPAEHIAPGVIDDVRGYLCPADEPHPYDIVCRSVVRIATVLSLDARLALAGSAGELSSVVKAGKHLAASLRELAARELPGAVSAGLRPIADLVGAVRLPPPSAAAASAAETETDILRLELLRALALLTDCAAWSERSGELVVAALRRAALFVSPWEQHMIVGALTFFPGPRG